MPISIYQQALIGEVILHHRGLGDNTATQRSLQETRISALLRFLEKRFGPQPSSLRQQLTEASITQLDAWILRVLDAASAEAVFQATVEEI